MSDGQHAVSCSWSSDDGYLAKTPYGEIEVFGDGGQRAVELMLLSAAACLNFYLAEYALGRQLPVTGIRVHCDGEIAPRPERVSHIRTRVAIDGDLSDEEADRMLKICERACKVMNTLRQPPECELTIENLGAGEAKSA